MDFQIIDKIYKTVSYQIKPENISHEDWQIALRRQFAENHTFFVENIGNHPVFSDFRVTNPENNSSYKIAIRGGTYDLNFCECMDFKTNGLGTCKHIEAVLLSIKRNESHRNLLDVSFQPNYSSVHLKYGEQRKVMLRVGFENELEIKNIAREYFDDDLCLKDEAFEKFDEFLLKIRAIQQSFRCYTDAFDYIIETRSRQTRNLIFQTYNDLPLDIVRIPLFEYQKKGVFFTLQAGRCLLADDMGLGKTIQAIAAAELFRKICAVSRVLIICPTSLKYQWRSEIERCTGEHATLIEGNATKRAEMYRSVTNSYIIISYSNVLTDFTSVQSLGVGMIILDEAQKIKNLKSKISQKVKQLDSEYAIALTGTPLENRLEELYSIMQFVNSYSLGPFYKFMSEYQVKDQNGKITGYRNLHQISVRLNKVMLRRTRSQVLDQLPERTVKNQLVSITPHQMKIHNGSRMDIAILIEKWKRNKSLHEIDRQRLLASLNTMRMVCDSTFLIDRNSHHDTKVLIAVEMIEEVINQGNEKIVVFSQWEKMTRLICQELQKRDIEFLYLHGQVSAKERGKMLETFVRSDVPRVFISTDAGSTGINLQRASVVINLDIPWSPAILEQRISRVHRLGQNRKVQVVNLIAADTIEQKMLDVISFKDSLAKGVLDNGDDMVIFGESRFNIFAGEIDKMLQTMPIAQADEKVEAEVEFENLYRTEEETSEPLQLELFGYDDIIQEPEFDDNQAIVEEGIRFFDSFAELMTDDVKRESFLNKMLHIDSVTGEKYLKIPIQSQTKGTALFARFISEIM